MRENTAYADASMIPELVALWMEAFGDDREYVERYFSHCFTGDNVMVYLADERPVSMLSLLPVRLHRAGVRIHALYVYAVATRKAYRRRGYGRELLLSAREERDEPLILKPDGAALAEYYRGIGFRDAFYLKQYDLRKTAAALGADRNGRPSCEGGQRYRLLRVTPSEYTALRNRAFAGEGYVEWNEAAVAYALLENESSNGFACKVLRDGRESILLGRTENNAVQILETTLSDEELFDVMQKLPLHPKEILVRRPADGRDGQMFGMLCGSGEIAGGYLNLALE